MKALLTFFEVISIVAAVPLTIVGAVAYLALGVWIAEKLTGTKGKQ